MFSRIGLIVSVLVEGIKGFANGYSREKAKRKKVLTEKNYQIEIEVNNFMT